jgi:flagellar basal-body rod protein FlgC
VTVGGAMDGMFSGFDISASGLRAEMLRSEIVASNISNMGRTGNKHVEPYRRKGVRFEEVLDGIDGARGIEGGSALAGGVHVSGVVQDFSTPFPSYHRPGDPMADEDGWVLGSNVDVMQEMVDLSVIERSFEANLAAMRTYRGMLQNVLANMRAS